MDKYKAVYLMEQIGEFDTFAGAFKAIYDKIQIALNSDEPLTWQVLETTIWVEPPNVLEVVPVMFSDARDLMCRDGHLVNNKWVD